MTDVIVVGAGPVGLTMACELVRHGVMPRIIDKAAEPSKLSKALAIHARSLEMLDQMGALPPFLERGWKVNAFRTWLDQSKELIHIDFDELDSPYPFILDVPQSVTEAILIEHLAKFGVQVERQVELTGLSQTPQGATVQLRHGDGREETAETSWLLGCDGAHSAVRHQLNAAFEGSAYPETFILADVQVEWDLPENQIQTFLHADGILGAFPYGGRRYRLMADVGGSHPGDAPLEPTLEQFQRIVDERGPKGTRICDPVWLAGFRSHLRHVKESRHGRVFLTGDAAHIHSPAGGQGMNTGMQDAANLAWKLALVMQGRAEEELLDTYPLERLPVAESVLKMSDTMLKMATMKGGLTRKLRDQLVPFLINKELVQRRFRNQVSEIAIHYRHSPIVDEHRSPLQRVLPHSVRAGDRAPDVALAADGSRGERRLFDLVRGTKHVLLLLLDEHGLPGEAFRWDILQRWGQLVDTYAVTGEDAQGDLPHGRVVVDPEHAIRERYGIGAGSLLLIRPDGYIGYLSDSLQLEPLDAYLSKLLKLN